MKRFLYLIFLTLFFTVSCNTAKFNLRERRILKKEYQDNILPLMLVSNKKDSVILYKKSRYFNVDSTDKKLYKLVDLMYHTCIDPSNPGVGIAAPQVGINKRIIWVQRFDKEKNPFKVYFNTEILYLSSSKSEGWEGCLSVPGYRGLVNRSDTVILKYDTFNKKNYIDTINGFTAVIFQHEIDHLEGILFTDRIPDKTKIFTEEEYKSFKKSVSD